MKKLLFMLLLLCSFYTFGKCGTADNPCRNLADGGMKMTYYVACGDSSFFQWKFYFVNEKQALKYYNEILRYEGVYCTNPSPINYDDDGEVSTVLAPLTIARLHGLL